MAANCCIFSQSEVITFSLVELHLVLDMSGSMGGFFIHVFGMAWKSGITFGACLVT